MARMGRDSERAAMICQHQARGADQAITSAIDAHVQAEQAEDDDDEDGTAGVLVPAGTLMAREINYDPGTIKAQAGDCRPGLGLCHRSG